MFLFAEKCLNLGRCGMMTGVGILMTQDWKESVRSEASET